MRRWPLFSLWRCWLGFHADELLLNWPTLRLRCAECYRETPGVTLTTPPAVLSLQVVKSIERDLHMQRRLKDALR